MIGFSGIYWLLRRSHGVRSLGLKMPFITGAYMAIMAVQALLLGVHVWMCHVSSQAPSGRPWLLVAATPVVNLVIVAAVIVAYALTSRHVARRGAREDLMRSLG